MAPDIFFLNLYDMSMDDKVGSIIDANVRQIAAQKQEIARIEATGAQNNAMQWYQWEQRYHALTPKQVAFLILQDELHSTDDQIARALGISESTVRVVRSRIKGREK